MFTLHNPCACGHRIGSLLCLQARCGAAQAWGLMEPPKAVYSMFYSSGHPHALLGPRLISHPIVPTLNVFLTLAQPSECDTAQASLVALW